MLKLAIKQLQLVSTKYFPTKHYTHGSLVTPPTFEDDHLLFRVILSSVIGVALRLFGSRKNCFTALLNLYHVTYHT